MKDKPGMTIGIPRGMYYYYLYPFQKAFFEGLGCDVVVSPPTHRGILDSGVKLAVDEACLPVKIFYGHVAALAEMGVDCVLVPRLVSLEPRTYLCPKLMGIPDMIRAEEHLDVRLLDVCVDLSRGLTGFQEELFRCGKELGFSRRAVARAYRAARGAQNMVPAISRKKQLTCAEAIDFWETGQEPTREKHRLTIGLLGHGYLVYDNTASMGLIPALRDLGCRVFTPEMLDREVVEKWAGTLPKRVFWSLGRIQVGAALAFRDMGLDGIIYMDCFGCGPDSMIGEVIRFRLKGYPFLMLTVDEHTGTAGLLTRVEAFCDMLERRRTLAGYVSSSG